MEAIDLLKESETEDEPPDSHVFLNLTNIRKRV